MKPHLASYSHTVVDSNGNKHEVGLHGFIEEGETYQQAVAQVAELVMEQTQQFVTNFDEEIGALEQEIIGADEEINARLDSLGSFTQFAEANGLDFKPPSFPFEAIQPQENINEQQRTEAGETATTSNGTE